MSIDILAQHIEMVVTHALHPHPDNPNVGNVQAIADSIGKNGFYAPVIAQRSTSRVLVGHHRLQAAKELGAANIPVIWLDVDDDAALDIMITDNGTASLGKRDDERLAAALGRLNLSDRGLRGTGYGIRDLDAAVSRLARAEIPRPRKDQGPPPREQRPSNPGAVWDEGAGAAPNPAVGMGVFIYCGDVGTQEETFKKLTEQGYRVTLTGR